MRSAVLIVFLGVTAAMVGARAGLYAQSHTETMGPSFEVASVKPSNPNPTSPMGSIPRMLPPVGGRLTATNMPLRLLVRMAYGVQDFQIDGGPSWQMSQKFDITAKAEDGFTGGTLGMLPMLKTLLADRFTLRVHTETREMPIATLVMARSDGKLGGHLKPSTSDCSNAQADADRLAEALAKGGPPAAAALLRPGEARPCSMMPSMGPDGIGLRADGQPMSVLVQLLTQATGKIVHDKTGLTGLYDWEMKFDPQVMIQMAAAQAGITLPAGANLPQSDAPSILTALREELGLKLDSDRGPVDVLVIDGAEMPVPD